MLLNYFVQFLQGCWITIQIAFWALLIGLVLGLLGAMAKLSHVIFLRKSVHIITGIIRGLPELLILFFIYFGSSIILSRIFGEYIEVSAFLSGVVALGLIFGAYATETIRGAFLSIPHGQWEAAKAYGLSTRQCYSRILIPQSWYHALPGLGNLWFVLLKDTALVALIGLPDIMQTARNISATTQQPFTSYSIAALLYLILTTLSMIGQKRIEKQTSRYLRSH